MILRLAAAAALALTPALTPARAADRAPECVTARVQYADGTGTHTWWWHFCGNGPGIESPLRDYLAGKTITVDGGPPGPGSYFFGPGRHS
jgi:hypothetical protein